MLSNVRVFEIQNPESELIAPSQHDDGVSAESSTTVAPIPPHPSIIIRRDEPNPMPDISSPVDQLNPMSVVTKMNCFIIGATAVDQLREDIEAFMTTPRPFIEIEAELAGIAIYPIEDAVHHAIPVEELCGKWKPMPGSDSLSRIRIPGSICYGTQLAACGLREGEANYRSD
ncbi:hypothetical protein ACLOJK_034153 [Asimina triloba]